MNKKKKTFEKGGGEQETKESKRRLIYHLFSLPWNDGGATRKSWVLVKCNERERGGLSKIYQTRKQHSLVSAVHEWGGRIKKAESIGDGRKRKKGRNKRRELLKKSSNAKCRPSLGGQKSPRKTAILSS